MPVKRSRTTKNGKVSKKRSRVRLNPRSLVPKVLSPSGFPSNHIVKQRFCTFVSLTQGIGPLPAYTFRANSVYDPDFTSGGAFDAQPMGFDQMAAAYGKYVVVNSTITVDWASTAAGQGNNYVVGVYLDENSTYPYTTWQGLREAKMGTSQLLTHQRNSRKTIAKYNPKRLFGIKDVTDNDDLVSVVTTNPTRGAFFTMWMQPLNGTTEENIQCMVTIDYDVMYMSPKQFERS